MATAVADTRVSTVLATSSVQAQRLSVLDALRGLASFSVFAFHVYVFSALPQTMGLPKVLDWLLRHGSLGVQVFFVLSGLVIYLSISDAQITRTYASRFALRRMLRLDPPYWATLMLATLLYTVMRQPPAVSSILAHCFYLQNLLGYRNIVSQFWTLCYEVQFYLFLILLIAFAQRAGKIAAGVAATVPLVISLVFLCTGTSGHGWFIDQWYAFAVGVATAGLINRQLRTGMWAAFTAMVLILGLVLGNLGAVTVASTSLLIGLASFVGRLTTWTGGLVLQWLGRISYSLYLTHFISSHIAKVLSARVHTRVGAIAVFAVTVASALLIADLFHRLVEQPSHRLSKRIRLSS